MLVLGTAGMAEAIIKKAVKTVAKDLVAAVGVRIMVPGHLLTKQMAVEAEMVM